jgi:aldehyde dehydrogenase (NAD+)
MIDRTPPPVFLRIGSEHRASGSGGQYDHIDPTTGAVDASIPLAGPAEIDEAVQTANGAFASWRSVRPAEKRKLLLRLADLFDQHADEFGRRGTLDNGTPLSLTRHSASACAEWTRYYAGWADKISSDVLSYHGKDGELTYSLAQPYGVVGAIITWNGAAVSLAMKIPAALAAGNTVVVKPSELTPFSGELFADLVHQAGFPEGVFSILPGSAEAGAALVAHPLVKKVSFTGGLVAARAILRSCAEQLKPSVVELGGKAANIVFDDADLDAACSYAAMMSVGLMSGQGCGLPTRLLVQRSIYDDVLTRVVEVAKRLKVGDPFDLETDSGPVINAAAVERIMAMIERAKGDGARLVTGGARLDGPLAGGYFIEPTIFADVSPASELAQAEVFGPVLAVMPFDTEEDAITIANSTLYGLSSYIQTSDLGRALRVADAMVSGEVLVNRACLIPPYRPFGGVGQSGFGREGGRSGLEEYLWTKCVAVT